MEERELTDLVGRWAKIRRVEGGPTGHLRRVSGAGAALVEDWVEVAVVGIEGQVLRCETNDPRALLLAGRVAQVETGASEALVRVDGLVRVLVDHPQPIVLAVTANGVLEQVQRRQWVRARVELPADVVASRADAEKLHTTTVDVSGGGACLTSAGPLRKGERVQLTLSLPDGQVTVEGHVVAVPSDGTARIAFERTPEGVTKRLVRFVFTAQVRTHRIARS